MCKKIILLFKPFCDLSVEGSFCFRVNSRPNTGITIREINARSLKKIETETCIPLNEGKNKIYDDQPSMSLVIRTLKEGK